MGCVSRVRGRILVVDDDEDVREAILQALSGEGLDAIAAADGAEAMRLLRQGVPPVLAIVDLLMPGISGNDLIAEMHRDPALAKIPIVAVSGSGQPAADGVAAFVRKPFLRDAFVRTVVEQLAPG